MKEPRPRKDRLVTEKDMAISAEQRAQIAQWVEENDRDLPDFVRAALAQTEYLWSALEGSRYQLNKALVQLRRALGIVTSSERRKSGDPIGPHKQADGLKSSEDSRNKETPY